MKCKKKKKKKKPGSAPCAAEEGGGDSSESPGTPGRVGGFAGRPVQLNQYVTRMRTHRSKDRSDMHSTFTGTQSNWTKSLP
jgi:hypothetical protein